MAEGEVDEDGKAADQRHHTTSKSLSSLLRSSNSKYEHKQHFCMNCLQGLPIEISRDKHFECCKDNETERIEMSEEGSFMKFHSGQYQFKTQFVMYEYFEAIQATNLNSEESYAKGMGKAYTKEINTFPLVFAFIASLLMERLRIH